MVKFRWLGIRIVNDSILDHLSPKLKAQPLKLNWIRLGFCFAEFRDATVAYNLESPTVPLDEVFFPSMVICNMNTLRRSFMDAILSDEGIKQLGVSYSELKNIIFSVFILGGDYQPTERDNKIIDSKCSNMFFYKLRNTVFTFVTSLCQCIF